MDYKKKYKDALERAKKVIEYYKGHHRCDEASIEDLECIFLELKESEDERVRKALIRFHKSTIDVDGIKGEDIIAWLEKQGDSSIKWNKNTEDNKPQVNHSVLMQTTHGIAEGEWQGEQWYQYRWTSIVRDTDVLSWMELSSLEKQGEQKPYFE